MDYDTKREVKRIMPRNSKWKCTDVMVLPGKQQFSDCSNRVILNIENEKYGKYYIFASELIKLKEWKNERFIFHEDFLKLQEIQRKKNAAAKAKAEAEAKMYAERQAEKNKNIIEKYGSYYGNLIIQGRVVIGMTKEMCREAWGEPKDINRTETAWTIHEQWVYYGNRYLYFENDKLTTIQN
jgi:hypothetical protein